jgi:transposase|tara:strand:+ start:2505 stop:2738 length:234 start_codon:yes stop_codon:yes gene_type:complete
MIGYSQKLAEMNKKANRRMLGVQLGSWCIKQGMPVMDIANNFKVSRTTVYNWFTGINDISIKHRDEAVKIIEWLKKA